MAQVLAGQSGSLLEEAVTLARQVGDPLALIGTLLTLGVSQMLQDPTRARTYLEEGARVARECGDDVDARGTLGQVGYSLLYQGELPEARSILAQVLNEADQADDRAIIAMSHYYLASVLAECDDRVEARRLINGLATIAREAGLRLYDVYQPAIDGWMMLVESDDREAAINRARQGVAAAFNDVTRANTLHYLIEGLLVAGMTDEAAPLVEDLITTSETAHWGYCLAWGLMLKARAARLRGDVFSALADGHEALNAAVAISAKTRIIDVLEELAAVAALLDSPLEAARLYGAAQVQRDHTGYARCITGRDADVEVLRDTIGDDVFQNAYDEGRTLSLEEAVAYARRGRGERKRPETGWASLTPAELRIAELVKDGLSNPEIGSRLLCSARTVQAHLTHIYAKLGVTSRSALAARATEQLR
jgi:DNA-binding CsgD family transcriptional regulator